MRNSMRNIGSIFLRDLRKLSRSTAALVVLIGLVIIFKEQITKLLENIFKEVNSQSKEVY